MTGIATVRDQVLAGIDIVDIAQECGFRRSRWKGWHCPWHGDGEDRRPSASIRGRWLRCFACGESWDVIGLVMRASGVRFPEALRVLAARLGIPASGWNQREQQEYAQRRHAAYKEGRELLDWRNGILAALRGWRDCHFRAYHRAMRTVIRIGLDSTIGQFAADVADVAEANYHRLDHQIAQIKAVSFRELLAHFHLFKGGVA